MSLTDRRCHTRWVMRGVRAWMFVENGKPVRCRVVDISRKGVLIKSSRSLVPGMKIELAFARTNGPSVTRLFRRWAQVARSTPNALAVFFVPPPSDANRHKRRI